MIQEGLFRTLIHMVIHSRQIGWAGAASARNISAMRRSIARKDWYRTVDNRNGARGRENASQRPDAAVEAMDARGQPR